MMQIRYANSLRGLTRPFCLIATHSANIFTPELVKLLVRGVRYLCTEYRTSLGANLTVTPLEQKSLDSNWAKLLV